jgi:hypothetical protein
MKNPLRLALFLSPLFLAASSASAATLEDCDAIYSKREQLKTQDDERLLRETLACLNTATAIAKSSTKSSDNLENERYDRMMVVLAALVQSEISRLPNAPHLSDDLSTLKNAIEKWRSVGGADGTLSYWSGVHLSFQCEYLDHGKYPPLETVRKLNALFDYFKGASTRAPETHHAGPDRVLGIMYDKLPLMYYGNTKTAEDYLRKAYTAAPKLSANALHFARILIKNGKRAEAEPILKRLKTEPETEWNPYPSALRFPRPETRADIELAKKL